MALVGDRLYVTGDNGPAPIFDVSAARAPRLLGRWAYEGGSASGVILEGTLAALTGAGGDVFFYEVSTPKAPDRVGVYHGAPPGRSTEFQFAMAAAASGSQALVTYETLPAHLLDISHPERPALQGTFTPAGLVHAIALAPTHAILGYRAPADGKTPRAMDPSAWSPRGGIESVDLRNPRAPRSASVLPLDSAVTDVARHESRLVAVSADGSLAVVDIGDPGRPVVLGRLTGCGSNGAGMLFRPTRVALSADGRLAFVSCIDAAAGAGTLTVVDLSEAATPRRLGQLNLERPGRAELPLAIDGYHVAILVGNTDVLIVDAGDPARPAAIARHALPPKVWAEGLAFENQMVFVSAGEDGLLIYRLPQASKGAKGR